MSQQCTCDTIRAIGWCPVHRPPPTRDAERRAATDREIVRVVRAFASDRHPSLGGVNMVDAHGLVCVLLALLTKEGEGTHG